MTDTERRDATRPDRRLLLPRYGGRRATDNMPRAIVEPRCPTCRHRMDGTAGMCSIEWCRCDCVGEVENVKKQNRNADRPPLGNKS